MAEEPPQTVVTTIGRTVDGTATAGLRQATVRERNLTAPTPIALPQEKLELLLCGAERLATGRALIATAMG